MDKKLKINEFILLFSEYLVYQKGLSENSVKAYVDDLSKFKLFIKNQEIDESNLNKFINHIADSSYSESTKKRIFSTIKQFSMFLVDIDELDIFSLNILKFKSSQKLPNILSIQDVESLINSFNHRNFLPSRNKTLIDFMYSTACRVSELCSVMLSDLDLEDSYVKLEGKGSKQRIVPIGKELNKNLNEYLINRSNFVTDNNFLFISKSGNKLDRTAVFRVVKQASLKSGLSVEIHPHTLRHSAATHMLEGGCDLRTVQEFLGHSSVSTTQIYTKVTKEFLEEAFIESHPRS